MKKLNKKQKTILIVVLFLFLSVAATTIIFMDRIREFLPNDEGAIALQEEDNSSEDSDQETTTGAAENEEESENESEEQEGPAIIPGFEVSDEEQIWRRETEIEIFSISYENGESAVTVQSDRGDKVIAPGTEQSYTFKVKNTGNVAMDYTIAVDAYVTPGELSIPIESRINRHDGYWMAGGADEWVDIATLDQTVGNYTLGAGRYASYTLDWRWIFESGDDEWDTYLGNLAVDEDITFTLVIRTIAEVSTDPGNTNGMLPQTGDSGNMILYAALMSGALLVMLLVLFLRGKEEE